MNLNYLSFFLIAFVPLSIGYIWYQSFNPLSKWSEIETNPKDLTLKQIGIALMMSLLLVYGYINLVIHQMGFYELFFTDIILGSKEAEQIVIDFLSQYGDKHRHFGHGVLHGVINAFIFALPFLTLTAFLNNKGVRYVASHFGYWLITSALIGGLISEFV